MPSIRQMLDSHERELLQRLDALQAQILPIEAELEEVRRARGALQLKSSDDVENTPSTSARHARMTNKELAIAALEEHFPDGALATEILDVIRNRWGRHIDRGSFSPQLSRLVKEGFVEKQGKAWKLKKTKA